MQHTDLLSPPPPLLTVTGEDPSYPLLMKSRAWRCTNMLYKGDRCIKVSHASTVPDCPDSVNPEIRNYRRVSLISGSVWVVFGRFLFLSNINRCFQQIRFCTKKKKKKNFNPASAVSTLGLDTEKSSVKGAEKEFHADE